MGLGTLILLEGIAESGSITRAARAMDMPDRQARNLVEQLNALFLNPIVLAQASGVEALTEFGTLLLDQLRAVDAAVNSAAASHMTTIEAAFR